MSENQEQKKPRAKRSASKFLVLEDLGLVKAEGMTAEVAEYLGKFGVAVGANLMVVRLSPSGIKSARAEIKKHRVVGNLLTVCVRRRGTSTLPQQPELKGL